MAFPDNTGHLESWDWICSLRITVILGCLLFLNLTSLFINIVLCRRRARSHQTTYQKHREIPDRTIYNFQAYVVQHSEWSSSVVIPTGAAESRDNSLEIPSLSQIPEQINCVEVVNHRKIFIGRVEWCGYEAFLKECINPIELQLHRKLSHENIVQFYWSNMVDKPRIIMSPGVECQRHLPLSFYCMEYCEGKSLNSFLVEEGHGMCLKEILAIILNVVSGLKYLHSQKIAHRDLKCENVMVQTKGQILAKIADFDHAIEPKTVSELNQHERNSFGSPLYTAPEFLLDKVTSPQSEDYLRHDIFSLGLLMWECLTWGKCRQNTVSCHAVTATAGRAEGETSPLLHPPLLAPRVTSTCYAGLSSTSGVTRESTHDMANYKSLVTCSSTVHIALLTQLCTSLNLMYNKKEKVLKRKGVFVRGDRLIDRDLMRELYTKNLHARPNLFPDTSETARSLNMLLEDCWRSEPRERWGVEDVYEVVKGIVARVQSAALVMGDDSPQEV